LGLSARLGKVFARRKILTDPRASIFRYGWKYTLVNCRLLGEGEHYKRTHELAGSMDEPGQ